MTAEQRAKPTPVAVHPCSDGLWGVATLEGHGIATGFDEDDADLIAEAFNVATETGMTPRQLADDNARIKAICEGMARANTDLEHDCAELLAALIAAVECGMVPVSSAKDGGAVLFSRHVEVADQIRAAIALATGSEGGAR